MRITADEAQHELFTLADDDDDDAASGVYTRSRILNIYMLYGARDDVYSYKKKRKKNLPQFGIRVAGRITRDDVLKLIAHILNSRVRRISYFDRHGGGGGVNGCI